MLQPGRLIDRYVVEQQIGQGGMAFVYRVRHKTLGTRHALKVLQSTNPEVRERMIIEGQVQAKLRHPNVVGVSDVVDIDGHPGLLMDFIRGPALDQWLEGYLPTHDEALALFRGIVAGVGYAHSRGLVHRDLKSANIMLQVDDDGVVPLVTDFGLAKVSRTDGRSTQSGTTFGTPTFMAPEQIRDASTVDRRADLYSLGCILYELFTGRTPHVGDDLIELFTAVASGKYTDPSDLAPGIPEPVLTCIDRLLQVDVNRRLTDCASVFEVLDNTHHKTAVFSGPLGPPRPMPDPGLTSLEGDGAGVAHARRFVRRIDTVDMSVNAEWEETTGTETITVMETSPSLLWGLSLGGVGLATLLALVAGLLMAVVLLLVLRGPATPEPTGVDVEPKTLQPEPTPTPVAPTQAPQPTEPKPTEPKPTEPKPTEPKPTEPKPVAPVVPAPPKPAAPKPVAPKPAAKTVSMRLKSKPWGAKVWIDGKFVGETPIKQIDVAQGNRKIRMEYVDRTTKESFSLKRTLRVHPKGSVVWMWNINTGVWNSE